MQMKTTMQNKLRSPGPGESVLGSDQRPSRTPKLMGKKLRALRKDAGLTLAQLSAKSGLSVGYLSQIERDISHPSIRSLTDLATIFDVSMGWLFDTPDPERSDEGKYIVRRENRGIMNLTPGIREEVLSRTLKAP